MKCSSPCSTERAHRALASEWAAEMALYTSEQTEPAQRWKLRPAVGAAGAGVLVGAVGALTVAGLLALRHRRVEAAA
ncbi:MAG: hypothetical protein HYX51_08030 [Chloroflexi bacterium]|nr:hypothetical protein [Chloroflexota bacterium]